MIDRNAIEPATLKLWARIFGGVLILAGIVTSFFNAVPAGFLYFTGAIALVLAIVDLRRLESMTLSGTALSFQLAKEEITQKVEEAEVVLGKIRQIEQRLIKTQLSALKLSSGGFASAESDIGEFQVFEMVKDYKNDLAHLVPIYELKRSLGLKFLWAIVSEARIKRHASGERKLKILESHFPDFKLKSPEDLEQLAIEDGIDIRKKRDVLSAYEAFFKDDKTPSEKMVRVIHALRYEDDADVGTA